MKKLIVILTGGGSMGAFQAGVWNRVLQTGLNFQGEIQKIGVPYAVFGESVGALNGAMIASGKSRELFKLWNTISGNPQEVYTSEFLKEKGSQTYLDTEAIGKYLLSDISLLQKAGLIFKKSRARTLEQMLDKLKSLPALASNAPLCEKVRQLIKIKDIKSEVFQAGMVSLISGKYYSLKHTDFANDEDFQRSVLASASIPLVFPPVESVKGHDFELNQLIDGGIRNNNPLGDAVKYVSQASDQDEYFFLVISCHCQTPQTMQEQPHLLNILKRSMYDIAMNEIGETDLSEFLRINELVKQANTNGFNLYSKSGRVLKSFNYKIIQPQRALGSALNFSRSMVMDSFLHGYETALSAVSSPAWE